MKTNSSATERGTIYTLGYSKREAAAPLELLMRHPRTLLVDVRYQPMSRWTPQWNRASLAGRYNEQYVWERRLGNIHYTAGDQTRYPPGDARASPGQPGATRGSPGQEKRRERESK